MLHHAVALGERRVRPAARRRTCRTAGGRSCGPAAGSRSLAARPRRWKRSSSTRRQVGGEAARRRPRAARRRPRSCARCPVGGSLTPSTRFQATVAAVAAHARPRPTSATGVALRSRRRCRRSPPARRARGGAPSSRHGSAGADAALLARPRVAARRRQTRSRCPAAPRARGRSERRGHARGRPAGQRRPACRGRAPCARGDVAPVAVPHRPEALPAAADPDRGRAQHQLRAEHADVAPGLQRAVPAGATASARAAARSRRQRRWARVAESPAVGKADRVCLRHTRLD